MTSPSDTKPVREGRLRQNNMLFFADRIQKARRFINADLLRHPTAENNVTMARFLKAGQKAAAQREKARDPASAAASAAAAQPQDDDSQGQPWDMIRERPCTPNDQYTRMNDEMIRNIKKNGRSYKIYHHEYKPRIPDNQYYKDRYATNTTQYLFRGQPGSNPHCWVDELWNRHPREEYSSSRLGASVPWGTTRIGCNTYSHFDGEDIHRYVHTDLYCRPPTNVVEEVTCKFGRAPSYYHQRKPHTVTWFGSSHELNRTDILKDHRPKGLDEYTAKWQRERDAVVAHSVRGLWPEYSLYTEDFTVRPAKPRRLTRLELNKQHVAEGKELQELEEQ